MVAVSRSLGLDEACREQLRWLHRASTVLVGGGGGPMAHGSAGRVVAEDAST